MRRCCPQVVHLAIDGENAQRSEDFGGIEWRRDGLAAHIYAGFIVPQLAFAITAV